MNNPLIVMTPSAPNSSLTTAPFSRTTPQKSGRLRFSAYIIAFLSVCLSFTINVKANTPEDLENTNFYKLTNSPSMWECDRNGNILTNTGGVSAASPDPINAYMQVAPKDAIVTVVDAIPIVKTENLQCYIVEFWIYTGTSSEAKNNYNKYNVTSSGAKRFFLIRKSDIEFARPYYSMKFFNGAFLGGVILTPIKWQLQNGDFTKDIALGPHLAYRFRLSHYSPNYMNLVLGANLSSVSITPENTNNSVTEASDRTAFSWSGGIVFEASGFQVALLAGRDYLGNSNTVNWVNHKKLWLGFGLGHSIFTPSSKNKDSGNQ